MAAIADTLDALQQKFAGLARSEYRGQQRVVVPASEAHDLLAELKNKHGFDLLVDVTCVDYLNYRNATDRFGLAYMLANTATNARLVVRTFVNEPDPAVPTVTDLWKGADWMEREVYDMFGVTFTGHPDLRRILMPEEFTAFPLRKDYPMQGRGERHNFPVIRRADA